ncbi:MAG: hypothetical protein GX654_18420 [Desulfatiglans sp.]|jgi:hypothetical protein|nr:hypothetical protein [Desulfatiglans sp.]
MVWKIIIIFVAGFIVDLLVTKYTRFITEKKIAAATLLSGIITVVNFVLLTMILQDSASNGMMNILAFAGGNSLGTFTALKKA